MILHTLRSIMQSQIPTFPDPLQAFQRGEQKNKGVVSMD
jgi:hypothetical protein